MLLITGGAGFIGSACLVQQLQLGREIVVLDSFEPLLYGRDRKECNLKWARMHGEFECVEADLRDRAALDKLFRDFPIDHVLHLAAVAGVRPSIENSPLYFDINVTGTAHLLESAYRAGCQRFALASSSSVYGGNEKTPFHEDDPVENPFSPYAASKRAMELLAANFAHLYRVEIAALRFFTVYGPRQRPEMAIHKFMRMLSKSEPIPMFGDGSSARDYTYIDDIVQGVAGVLDRQRQQADPSNREGGKGEVPGEDIASTPGFRIYNLGGDKVVTLRDLIETLGEVMGMKPQIDQLPMQPGDVPITCADISRARHELDYEPQTPLRRGIEIMWSWYQKAHS